MIYALLDNFIFKNLKNCKNLQKTNEKYLLLLFLNLVD